MTSLFLTSLVLAALVVGSGCTNSDSFAPPSSHGPSPRNSDSLTFDVQIPDFTACPTAATLKLHLVGWVQLRVSIPGDYLPYHLEFVYSNAAGETYAWAQTGLARPYRNQGGDRILPVAGRTGSDGRVLVNLTRGGVQIVSGDEAFAEDLACAALT